MRRAPVKTVHRGSGAGALKAGTKQIATSPARIPSDGRQRGGGGIEIIGEEWLSTGSKPKEDQRSQKREIGQYAQRIWMDGGTPIIKEAKQRRTRHDRQEKFVRCQARPD